MHNDAPLHISKKSRFCEEKDIEINLGHRMAKRGELPCIQIAPRKGIRVVRLAYEKMKRGEPVDDRYFLPNQRRNGGGDAA